MQDLEKREKIWQVVYSIPFGKVATYNQVANLAGLPGYARYVGTTMKLLPRGSKLPWFRVINSRGELSLPFNGKAYLRQKQLLVNEGIVFKGEKIPLRKFAWHQTD
jgi:methylated-DNA-protein-cysteine methyltransferase related protein